MSKTDHSILLLEARAINASVDWTQYKTHLDITIQAPKGFVWVSTNEPNLTLTIEKSDPTYAREAVTDLLTFMSKGYIKVKSDHDSDCECQICELEQETEVEELNFQP